jgi:23S rRNA pseudouridine2605 synthase
MAARGSGSRRSAEDLIRAGRVTVDDQVVTELGTKVDAARAEIRVDGRILRRQRPRSILLNKPSGYITTTSDERSRWTVMDLVDVPERVYPVGRLDRDTEGLLLLTNDGEVANRVMHPRYQLEKEYHVLTPARPHDRTLQRVRDGITIDGKRIVPEEFRILRETRDGLLLKIVIHEGFFHAVRRIMETVGIPVQKLRRVRVGPLAIEGIPTGTWRDLTPGEEQQLAQALRLDRDEGTVAGRAAGTASARRSRGERRRSQRSDTAGSDREQAGQQPRSSWPESPERARRGDRLGSRPVGRIAARGRPARGERRGRSDQADERRGAPGQGRPDEGGRRSFSRRAHPSSGPPAVRQDGPTGTGDGRDTDPAAQPWRRRQPAGPRANQTGARERPSPPSPEGRTRSQPSTPGQRPIDGREADARDHRTRFERPDPMGRRGRRRRSPSSGAPKRASAPQRAEQEVQHGTDEHRTPARPKRAGRPDRGRARGPGAGQ